jgi:hypothetical protein
MHLNTMQVDDWARFIEENNIDLSCPTCRGKGEIKDKETDEVSSCDDCGGSGYIEPLWNTVWDTGYHASTLGEFPREPAPNVFAFEHEDHIWLGLSCCGMDCTPYLALAWVNLLPGCRWVPLEFMVTGVNLRGGYLTSCLGVADAMRVLAVMESGLEGAIDSLGQDLKDVRDAVAKLAGSGEVGRKV